MLSEEELHAQADDIKTNGLIHRILLFEGKILDGRNRYVACGMVNVEPKFETFNGTFSDAMTRVWSENIHRRDLTSSQRAAIAVSRSDIVDRIEAEAKKRQEATQLIGKNVYGEPLSVKETFPEPKKIYEQSRDTIAKTADTNPRYISDVKKIKKESPKVFEMVKTGNISIPEAKKVIKLEPTTQAKVIKEIETPRKPSTSTQTVSKVIHAARMDEIKKDIAIQTDNDPNRPHIDCDSFNAWIPKQQKCDLLLTDPPYTTDIDDIDEFANDWLPKALDNVKETGRAYIFIGAYPDEIGAYLAAAKKSDMTLANILVWTYRNTIGPSPTHDYKLNWQAILYFRGKDAPPLNAPLMTEQFSVQDINAPDGRFGEGRYHKWQKPDELAERLIRHSTEKGDIVMDCFAGTGTFMLAATRLGRNPIGCDIDSEILLIAKDRGCDINGI